MAIVRKHIYFSGQVQGVGFRYRAKNAARANDLTGWVDNLWDGRVEMEVQGELSGIERMIQEIEMGSFIRIENYQMEDLPVDERVLISAGFRKKYIFIIANKKVIQE